MTVLQSIFLGLLQGFTEFLPVSSSGHLILAQKLWDIPGNLFFDVMLHLGTLLAVVIAMRKTSDVLQKGEFIPLETGPQVFAYRRRLQDKQLTIVLNFSNDPASCAHSGTLLKSNYPRRKFGGTLQPWEAVILG